MKSTLLLSSALLLALASGAQAQSAASTPGTAGTSVGPATGRPDVPPEPPAAKVQQPGKEGLQAQSAAPGGTGTAVGPATGTPDVPSEPPSAKVQQPSKQATGGTGMGNSQGQAVPGQQGSGSMQQGMNPEDGTGGRGHVTTTHELKQALQQQGFSDVRILAESFVVQAMKDGRRVTMMLGPNGLDAVQIVDERGLQDDDTTGTVTPDAGAGGPAGEAPQQ